MIVASCFIEIDNSDNIQKAVKELEKRNIKINDVYSEKIVFLVKKEALDKIKAELDSIKTLGFIKNVHLTYYSIE